MWFVSRYSPGGTEEHILKNSELLASKPRLEPGPFKHSAT